MNAIHSYNVTARFSLTGSLFLSRTHTLKRYADSGYRRISGQNGNDMQVLVAEWQLNTITFLEAALVVGRKTFLRGVCATIHHIITASWKVVHTLVYCLCL